MSLRSRLEDLRPALAAAAQGVIDLWEQDDEGYDEEFGSGGACDAVAIAMAGALGSIDTMDGGHDGDDHAYLIAYNDTEACVVDIPPGVYERGGGYNWRKIPGVQITEDDVVIEQINRGDIDPEMRENATIYGRRFDIRRGFLLMPKTMTGPNGKTYTVDLEFQVWDAETGAPIEDTRRVEGELHGDRLVIGDPHRDTRLFEYKVAAQPTSESENYWKGYRAALADRQWHLEGKSKKYYGQTQAWWDGYNQGHRDKKDPSAGHTPNAGRRSKELAEARRAQREEEAAKRAGRGRLTELKPGEHLETRGVLAGAYRGADLEERSLLTHSVICEGDRDIRTLCSQPVDHVVDSYGYSEEEKAQAPTCPTCRPRWEKLSRSGSGSRIPTEYDGDIPSEYYGTKPKRHTPNARLEMFNPRAEESITRQLRVAKLRAARGTDLSSAVIAAGNYAKGQGVSCYVYQGNSHMHLVYRATPKKGEVLSPINNGGDSILEVTPDLSVTRWDVRRPDEHTPNARHSTHGTVIEYAVQEMFKGKSPSVAAKNTAAKLNGGTNMFIDSVNETDIDPRELEDALLDRMSSYAAQGRVAPGQELGAVRGALMNFNQWQWGKPPKVKLEQELLRRLQQKLPSQHTPNAPGGYYVWVLLTDGTPKDGEGPYGPMDFTPAKDFARISATEGAHDRAVSIGLNPQAESFSIVRHYRRGTGERVQ